MFDIHRYWTGIPPTTEPYHAVVLSRLGRLHDWTDATLPGDVITWLDQAACQVTEQTLVRHRANMVRWWALHNLGGIWFDHDALPLVRLEELGELWTCAVSQQQRTVCGAAFPAGHPLPAAILARIDAHVGAPVPCWELSGDRMLDRLCPAEVPRVLLPVDAAGHLTGAPARVMHSWASTHERFI